MPISFTDKLIFGKAKAKVLSLTLNRSILMDFCLGVYHRLCKNTVNFLAVHHLDRYYQCLVLVWHIFHSPRHRDRSFDSVLSKRAYRGSAQTSQWFYGSVDIVRFALGLLLFHKLHLNLKITIKQVSNQALMAR